MHEGTLGQVRRRRGSDLTAPEALRYPKQGDGSVHGDRPHA